MEKANVQTLNAPVVRNRGLRLAGWGALALTLTLGTVTTSRDSHAGGKHDTHGRCVGTYLVQEEGSGARTLWTFHEDGTLVSSSSGELFWGLSSQQGSWQSVGRLELQAVQLNFDWDTDTALPEAVGRLDITASAEDRHCNTMTGAFEGRLYPPDADPLDKSAADVAYGDTFTARRVKPY